VWLAEGLQLEIRNGAAGRNTNCLEPENNERAKNNILQQVLLWSEVKKKGPWNHSKRVLGSTFSADNDYLFPQ